MQNSTRPLYRLLGIGAVAVLCPLAGVSTSGASEPVAAASAPLLSQQPGEREDNDNDNDTGTWVRGPGSGATAVNSAGAGGYASQTANQTRTDNRTRTDTRNESTTVNNSVSHSHNRSSQRDSHDNPPR